MRTLLRIAYALDLGIGLAVGALILGLAGPERPPRQRGGRCIPGADRDRDRLRPDRRRDDGSGAAAGKAPRAARLGDVQDQHPAPDRRPLALAPEAPEVLVAYAAAAFAGALLRGLAWRVGWSKWVAPSRGGRTEWVRKLHSSASSRASHRASRVRNGRRSSDSGASARELGIFAVALFPSPWPASPPRHCGSCCFPSRHGRRPKATSTALPYHRGATRIGLAIESAVSVAGWFLLPVLLPPLYSGEFEDAIGPARILLIAASPSGAGVGEDVPAGDRPSRPANRLRGRVRGSPDHRCGAPGALREHAAPRSRSRSHTS